MSRKPLTHDSWIQVRLPQQWREDFNLACKVNEVVPAAVIRRFIHRYIEETLHVNRK